MDQQDTQVQAETKKVFVGNLPFATTKDELVALANEALKDELNADGAAPIGEVTDAYKPEMKGFGFITCSTEEAAQKLIEKLNGTEFGGRELVVNLARPRAPRAAGSYQDRGSRGGYNRQSSGRSDYDRPRRDYGNDNRY